MDPDQLASEADLDLHCLQEFILFMKELIF